MVDTDDTRRTTDDGRRTTDDGRRTTPRVWHKLPTGELKMSAVDLNQSIKNSLMALKSGRTGIPTVGILGTYTEENFQIQN